MQTYLSDDFRIEIDDRAIKYRRLSGKYKDTVLIGLITLNWLWAIHGKR